MYRWEHNIKMDLKGISCEDVNCNELAQNRVQWWDFVNMVMNF